MSKVGRNDKCPCGSGKKYKHCCLEKEKTRKFSLTDDAWNKLRRTEGEVIDKHLLPHVRKINPEIIENAWLDFVGDEEKMPEEMRKNLFHNMFIPWFLFNWSEDKFISLLEGKSFADTPIALTYLKKYERRLTEYQRNFIQAMCDTYYSYYVVLDVVPDKSLLLKDILLSKEVTVKERSGTHFLKKGSVILSRILTFDDQSISVGMAPYIMPNHTSILDFRDDLVKQNNGKELTPKLLRNKFEIDLLDEFIETILAQFNSPGPILYNTDGDLWRFCTLNYDLLCSPKEAYEALLPLTLEKDPNVFLDDAVFDKKGELQRVNFHWLKRGNKKHKSWNNTLIGDFKINKNKLTIEVNSEKRASKAQQLVEKYLGKSAKYKLTIVKSFEQMQEESENDPVKESIKSKGEIVSSQEEQAFIKEMAKKHWRSWVDEKIPVLGNITPREAVKTKAGKERLEALLLDFEHRETEDNLFSPDFVFIRNELGLKAKKR